MQMESKDSPRCEGAKILVVDDEAPIRTIFQLAISSFLPHATIDQATNGAEAVTLFQNKRHDVITMDLRMPVMDGWQAFQAIQQFCSENGIRPPPVIFVTGYALPKLVDQIVGNGSYHGLLVKPVMLADIISEVKKRLSIASNGRSGSDCQ